MSICCVGDLVQIKLNGTTTAEANMSQNDLLRDRPRSGYIGLSNFLGEAKGTAFRNIRIRELDKNGQPLASADIDRAAAEWVLKNGGSVTIAVADKTNVSIKSAAALPRKPFRVEGIVLDRT